MRGDHTPGPWQAEMPDMFGDINIVLRDDTEDCRAIACAVCNLRPGRETFANSRLIAAAPDLLAALENAIALYGKDGGPWNVPRDPGGWLDRARAAIAKARA